MSSASPVNVVEAFLSAGITLFLSRDVRPDCRVCPDRARWLTVRIDPSHKPEPTDDEVDEFEREFCLEHCLDGVGEGTPSESEQRISLIFL
jgi:hypothetical protein